MKNILVIGAHFDDAELGAGGSMARWVQEGRNVYKLTLTDNVTNFEKNNIHVDYESSSKESSRVCDLLGVTEVTSISIGKCTELKYNKTQMQEVENFIYDQKIDTVIMHYTSDIQQDHIEASTISYVASRYCAKILMYQSNRYILPTAFYPRFFVDITDTIELKKEALNIYSSDHNRMSQLFELTIQNNRLQGYSAINSGENKYVESFAIIKYTI